MALAENAIVTDQILVWEYLQATEEERTNQTLKNLMDQWINGASSLLERLCNRPIVARTWTGVTQDGSGRRVIYAERYPLLTLSALTINDHDNLLTFVMNVTNDIDIDRDSGRITLRAQNPSIGVFLKGFENIALTYKAGYEGEELAPFIDALFELISIKWQAMGHNPLEFVRSDSIGTNASSTMFDPRRLPHIVQQVVNAYRKLEV